MNYQGNSSNMKLKYIVVSHKKDEDIATEEHSGHSMPKAYHDYIAKHGFHFTSSLAECASSTMKNVDGSSHIWSTNQIASILSAREPFKRGITVGDITYAANMAYSDFYPEVLKDAASCVEYAIALAKDPDGYEGQIFARWIADVKHKNLENKIDWHKYE